MAERYKMAGRHKTAKPPNGKLPQNNKLPENGETPQNSLCAALLFVQYSTIRPKKKSAAFPGVGELTAGAVRPSGCANIWKRGIKFPKLYSQADYRCDII